MPDLTHFSPDRLSMGERPNEMTGEEQPERREGAAASSENNDGMAPDARSGARTRAGLDAGLDVTGSLSGTTIGHYQIGERLGGGAMAAVYRAYDQILDRRVAIKVLLPGADAVMQKRFRREARMVSTLVHPHIVRTLQVGRSGGIIYIAMELVEGASLGDLLERHGKLSAADAARLLAPVAAALAYAHERGIVHRDVKPSNILLQRAARGTEDSVEVGLLRHSVIPLLSDFGIARALDAPELTSAGRTIGTPAFMAPEQCAGSADIDGRADVYALGAVLYRCLVGKAPFAGTTTQILHAHVYDDLMIPDAVADSLPAPMVDIMARAMMKEPSQRYARIEEMAAELQQVAELPEVSAASSYPDLADSTMTMASLPVAQSPANTTSRVLVPAARIQTPPIGQRPNPLKPVPRAPQAGTTPTRAIPVATPQSEGRRSRLRRNRWGMLALAGAFTVLVILAAGMLINSVLPGVGESFGAGDATPTAAAVAQNGTPALPVVVPDSTREGNAATPAASETDDASPSRSTPEPSPTGPTATPQPLIRDLEPKWLEAQAAFANGEWVDARDALIVILRSMEPDELLPFEDEIDTTRLNEMLAISFIGLATDAAILGQWEDSIAQLERAIEYAPNVTTLGDIVRVLTDLSELEADNGAEAAGRRKTLHDELAALFATYANRLTREGRVCDAVSQADNAIQFAASEQLEDFHTRLGEECDMQRAGEAIVELGGSILYSTGGSGTPYNIWRLPVASASESANRSTLVVSNAAQPSLSPNGSMLAYFSRAEGADGLYGIGMTEDLTTWGNPIHLSANPEDSRDSPPSWNPSGTQITYSTQRGERDAPRIYVTSADANSDARDLGIGRDPAWSPDGSIILLQGPNGLGSPGLRAVGAAGNGADRYDVTGNGNDLRPVWTSDGRYVIFMSQDRIEGTSWEVYRMDWITKQVVLLSDGLSTQEGLPAISPDNEWVAFLSDRGGSWNLYYVSIDGGQVHQLSSLSGQPISWLEHGIQWVE